MTFFGLEMTPSPLSPLFGHFFQNLRPKYTVLKYKKSAMNFLDRKWPRPRPPFRTFSKKTSKLENTDTPKLDLNFSWWELRWRDPLPALLVWLQLHLNLGPHLLCQNERDQPQRGELLCCTGLRESVGCAKPDYFHRHHLDHPCNRGSFTDSFLSDETF